MWGAREPAVTRERIRRLAGHDLALIGQGLDGDPEGEQARRVVVPQLGDRDRPRCRALEARERCRRVALLAELGPDTGFDSMGDWNQIEPLGAYLNQLESEGLLPRTILYNVNPVQNYALSTMAGNFQDGTIPGKIQFGSGWWFLDQKEGMEWQMNALSNTGLLSRFVGEEWTKALDGSLQR